MNRTRATVADLRANTRQLTMLHVESAEEAAAADAAGIDLLSIEDPIWTAGMRLAAPNAFVFVGLLYGHLVTTEDYLRAAHRALLLGGDAVYCAASVATVARLAAEGIPVCGHAGLIPSKRTWTGGFRAVGRTADSARLVHDQVRALEDAGAFAAELEVVPARVAEEIARRSSLLLISMGAGAGCAGQYLFSSDVLGTHDGHYPRHAKVYRDFRAEHERLQKERVAAFGEFAADVASGAYPAPDHTVGIPDDEFAAFRTGLEGHA